MAFTSNQDAFDVITFVRYACNISGGVMMAPPSRTDALLAAERLLAAAGKKTGCGLQWNDVERGLPFNGDVACQQE